jgi:PAS domain-containing protein
MTATSPRPDADAQALEEPDSIERLLEAARREQQETLRLAMRAGRMGAWVRDMETGTVAWDGELEELFGLPAGGFRGSERAFFELVHPDDAAGLELEIDSRSVTT